MAKELRVKEFSALPVADDGKTLLYTDGEVKQSRKNLSEMLTNKLDTTAFSTVSGSFLTALQVIPSGKWENVSDVVIANSAIWGSETDWTDDINAASAFAYEQAEIQIDKKLDKTLSSNFYPMNENPSGYLTAHQDLSDYVTTTELETVSSNITDLIPSNGDYVEHSELNCKIGTSNNTALDTAFAQGQSVRAETYGLAQGSNCVGITYSLAQGINCTGFTNSLAQGNANQATMCSIAQGEHCSANNTAQAFGIGTVMSNTGMAIGQYNKTTSNAAFVIGNGTGTAYDNRKDLFVIDKNGIASGGDFITSAGKKLSDCITTLPTITEYVAGTGIVFTAGSGANVGKMVIEVDITGGGNGEGNGGDYVPLSAIECTIGSGNSSISGSLAQGENNSAGYIIVYPEETIEDEVIPEHSAVLGYSFAQGKNNLSYSSSLAQGVSNSATHGSFAQGLTNYSNYRSVCFGSNNSAEGFSFAQGYGNNAYENSFAQGTTTTASWNSVAMGNSLSANTYSVAMGSGLSSKSYSFNFGVYNFAEKYSQTFGYGLKATNYATAYGYDGDVVTLGSFVIGEFNKTSAAPFVIGNGTFEGNRSDLFVVDKDGNVSAQGQIYAGGGVIGAALDTLELAPDNETIEFVTSSHNVVNGGSGLFYAVHIDTHLCV